MAHAWYGMVWYDKRERERAVCSREGRIEDKAHLFGCRLVLRLLTNLTSPA